MVTTWERVQLDRTGNCKEPRWLDLQNYGLSTPYTGAAISSVRRCNSRWKAIKSWVSQDVMGNGQNEHVQDTPWKLFIVPHLYHQYSLFRCRSLRFSWGLKLDQILCDHPTREEKQEGQHTRFRDGILVIFGRKFSLKNFGGVGFSANPSISHLVTWHEILSPHLAILCLQLRRQKKASIISCNSSTCTGNERKLDPFYN